MSDQKQTQARLEVERRQQVLDRADNAMMQISRLQEQVEKGTSKKAKESREALLRLEDDVRYVRDFVQRVSIPFMPNR
jgi:archaellum component FlaC